MRDSTIEVLDEADQEFVELLRGIGVQWNVAKLIAYLKNVDETPSKEIEKKAGLRQPEVSIGMRTLRENGWVEEKEVKRSGKGRPTKIYKLTVPVEDIIRHYEKEHRTMSVRTSETIQKLRHLGAEIEVLGRSTFNRGSSGSWCFSLQWPRGWRYGS